MPDLSRKPQGATPELCTRMKPGEACVGYSVRGGVSNTKRHNEASVMRNEGVGRSDGLKKEERAAALFFQDAERPLTNYKKVVDIVRMYGLSEGDLSSVHRKIRKQNTFLTYSYISDKFTGQSFSLKDCIISSNHNPKRYHGEIQNRINTLEKEATSAGLTPVFLTMTLPGEFHRKKQGRGKALDDNPGYNGTAPREAVKVLTKMFGRLRHDRSLKELTKAQRMYYRVNEPHKDGTPHTHILLFIPADRIARVERAFYRLFNPKGNKFEKNIRSAASYIMKGTSKNSRNRSQSIEL